MRTSQRGYALRGALGLQAHRWRRAELASYRFGSRSAAHHYCKVCGIFPFSFYLTGAAALRAQRWLSSRRRWSLRAGDDDGRGQLFL